MNTMNSHDENITSRANGPDLSYYDNSFDPQKAAGQIDFAIQRASHGTTQDPLFKNMVKQVMSIPIKGAYHYLSSSISYTQQADKFLSVVDPYPFDFYVCDFEDTDNSLSIDFAYLAWQFIDYVHQQTKKPCLLYTSPNLYDEYISNSQERYHIDWNTIELWIAEWPKHADPNGNPTMPIGRTNPWRIWQYTKSGNPALYGLGSNKLCDLSVYNGTPADMHVWLTGSNTQLVDTPQQDTKTTPHPGMTRISGKIPNQIAGAQKINWQFELFIIDPAQVRYEAVCLSPIETVSSVTERKGATLGINGGEWDRVKSLKDYGVSNGQICVQRKNPQPSLMITKNNQVIIDHKNAANVRQALSGLRYLIQDGKIEGYLSDPTNPQYTEGHARSIHGITVDGKHLIMQSEGQYPNMGLTLLQAAETMKQYGAVTAFDSGGGGDVTCILDGQSLITTENIDKDTHKNFERPLPQVFLIYAKEEQTT